MPAPSRLTPDDSPAHKSRFLSLRNSHAAIPHKQLIPTSHFCPSSSAMPLQTQPSSSPLPPATPPTSRLPDYHVLGSLTDVKPGTIPLLVRMPDGNCEQLDVPLHSTVDDIASSLQKDSNDVFRLSFGNNDLDPSASLLDTNIVDAYEHAGSLLHLIASGRQDAQTKAAALDSACAVVETISNGIKDMEALCAAAMPDNPHQSDDPPSPPADREDPAEVERTAHKPFQDSSDPTPSQLAYTLSRRLPNLFPQSGTAAPVPQEEAEQPTLGRQPSVQPSLSSIRDARRRASALRQAQEDNTASNDAARLPDIAIGESTNVPLPLNLEQPSPSQHRDGGSSLMLATSEKATWLEDVMKTWEVDTVRESGVLEKSKDGQEISSYLQSLEDEAEREVEVQNIENQQQAPLNPTSAAPGESSDEEGENGEEQGDTNHDQPLQNTKIPNGRAKRTQDNTTDELQKSIAAVNISDRSRSNPATQILPIHDDTSAGVVGGATTSGNLTKEQRPVVRPSQNPSPSEAQKHQPRERLQSISKHTQTLPREAGPKPPAQSKTSASSNSPTSSGTALANNTRQTEKSSSSSDSRNRPPVRQATKIAPAPTLAAASLAGTNGLFTNQMYPVSAPVPSVPWPPRPTTGPKKRGRKRKNPELTDEERALARKEQNRESAKLSRVRRKVIAAKYEGRLNALVEENTMLRKQVEGLNNRLVYLQSLLTVSVRQEPQQS